MAIIKPKHGTTAPSTGLAQYELAVDTTNKRVYIGNASGSGDLIGSAPGGSNTQIQYNNSSNFGGSANFTFDGTNLQIGSQGDLRLADSDSSNYIAFQAPATVSNNNIYTLPSAVGSANQVLQIASVAGNDATLQWATVSGGSGTPGGSNTQVQFNDSSSFGGDSGLTYNKTTDSLTITGDLAVNGGDITTSSATAALFNTTATTIDAFGAASIINIGVASGLSTTITLNNITYNYITVPENVALALSSPGSEDSAGITIQGSASPGGATVSISGALSYNGSITGSATWLASTIGADRGGTGNLTYADGDILYAGPSTTTSLSKLAKPAVTSFLQMTSAGTPSWVAATTITPDYLLFDMGIV
jgi:hypothetical protein